MLPVLPKSRLMLPILTRLSLLCLLAIGTLAQAQYSPKQELLPRVPQAQTDSPSVSATELRHMTAARFQAGIDKEGAQAFTARLIKEDDPHNWDEPRYDMILNHIATGQTAWLKIASEIGPYTVSPYSSEPNFAQGLNVALAYALLENPTGVIRMRHADEHFMHACMYPFQQPSDAYVHKYQRQALLALKRIHDPALKAQAEDCRKELLSPPTEKASN
jgi:hypothetical protein